MNSIQFAKMPLDVRGKTAARAEGDIKQLVREVWLGFEPHLSPRTRPVFDRLRSGTWLSGVIIKDDAAALYKTLQKTPDATDGDYRFQDALSNFGLAYSAAGTAPHSAISWAQYISDVIVWFETGEFQTPLSKERASVIRQQGESIIRATALPLLVEYARGWGDRAGAVAELLALEDPSGALLINAIEEKSGNYESKALGGVGRR